MAEFVLGGESLRVSLSGGEQVRGRRRQDLVIPLNRVRSVRTVSDGLAAARNLHASLIHLPGSSKVSSRTSRGRRTFASVRRDQPAMLISLLPRSGFDVLLIGTDRAEEAAADLMAALPPHRRDELVVVDTDHGQLRGSLRLPGEGQLPAALLLPGSGPIDRDGDAPGSPLGIQIALAEALAAEGVASLRYDRRGIGDGSDWRSAGLTDNTDDAAQALAFLAGHPRVDPTRVVVIGHSEGSVHALRLATREPRPAAAVLLSAPARSGGEVLLWQAEQLQPSLPKPAKAIVRVARIDLTAKTRAAHNKLRDTTTDIARVNGGQVNAKWFREFLDDDPREILPALEIPTLALTGTADLQTPPSDTTVIAELAPGPVDIDNPAGISHFLRRDPAPVPTLQDYKRQLREPVDPDVLQTVADWVVDRVGG